MQKNNLAIFGYNSRCESRKNKILLHWVAMCCVYNKMTFDGVAMCCVYNNMSFEAPK
jgi:hypothetical protein